MICLMFQLLTSHQFKDGEVRHEFHGVSYTYVFKYQDPWEWLLDIVSDSTLCNSIFWYPVEKYLHQGVNMTRIYDETNTGKCWWEIQVCYIVVPLNLGRSDFPILGLSSTPTWSPTLFLTLTPMG